MRKITSGIVPAVVVNDWSLLYGIQFSILIDRRAEFVANVFKTVCHLMGIKRHMTTAYHPQTNVKSESYKTSSPRDSVTICLNFRKNRIDKFNHKNSGTTINRIVRQARRYSTSPSHAHHRHQRWTRFRQAQQPACTSPCQVTRSAPASSRG